MGHVIVRPFDLEATEMHHRQLPIWLNLVDVAKVKAFVELTIASTVRQGAQSLLTVSVQSFSVFVCVYMPYCLCCALDYRTRWNETKHSCNG